MPGPATRPEHRPRRDAGRSGPSPGLTLIELVVALAVLAVLGTLALPNLGARLDRSRVEAAAEALAADINEARFEAARQGRAIHLQVNSGPGWCWSVATADACPCGSGQGCQLRASTEKDHPGVLLSAGQSLTMAADGRPQTAGEPLELQGRNGLKLRVLVSPMGRAHVCTLQGEATRHPACGG